MATKRFAVLMATLVLAACTQTGKVDYTPPEKGDPEYMKGKNTRADALYISSDTEPDGRDFRNVYVEPADLSDIRIIQPEGASADEEWAVSDVEDDILQKAIIREFTHTLGYQSAFNIVEQRDEAEIIVHTTVVAIHPYATRPEVEAGARSGGAITASIALVNARSGGAITASIALVNARTGAVMVRSVDTKSTDNIWAFHQVNNDEPGYNLIFRNWGNSIRRGMLQLQGRSTDPLAQPVLVKKQQ